MTPAVTLAYVDVDVDEPADRCERLQYAVDAAGETLDRLLQWLKVGLWPSPAVVRGVERAAELCRNT